MPAVTIFAVALLMLAVLFLWNERRKRKNLPPGPPTKWPIVGNAFELGPVAHVTLTEMSKRYGPVFRLKLGLDTAVVLNNYENIKKMFCLEEASARPRGTIADYIITSYGLVLCDGNLWKEHRRFAMSALRQLGMGKSWLQEQILDETDVLIRAFADTKGQPVDPAHLVTNAISNIICAAAVGKRYSYDDEYFQALLQNERLYTQQFNQISPLDLFPILRFVPPFSKVFQRRLEVTDIRLTHIDKAIEESKMAGQRDPERMDYVNLYLRERERQLQNGVRDTTFDDKQLRYSVMDLFGAGTETTSSTILLGLICMVENPDVLRRLQEELDTVVRRDEPVRLEHRPRLAYMDATISEILRLHAITPLGLFHRTTESVKFDGYDIPSDTLLVSNLYAANQDPALWINPEKFDPLRHIDENGKFNKSPYVASFSIGKRACPGEALAQWELFLVFGNILHKFDLIVPDGETVSSENVTINNTIMPNPVKLIFKPRPRENRTAVSRSRINSTYFICCCASRLTKMIAWFLGILIILLLVAIMFNSLRIWKDQRLPPSPFTAWPIIGNVLHLGQLPHLKLMEMSQRYGPILRLKLGSDVAVVFSDYELLKKAFSQDETSGRPRNTITDVMIGNNTGLIFSDGNLWKEHRRFALSTLRDLGMGKSWLQEQILDEADRLVRALAATQGQPTDPLHLVTNTISNIICAAAVGKRYNYDDEYFRALLRNERSFVQMFNQISMLDLFPVLRFVPPFRTLYKKRLEVTQIRYAHIAAVIDEAKKSPLDNGDKMDYVNMFLSEQRRQRESGVANSTFDDEQLLHSIADLFGAGTETTSNTILFGLLFMVENPAVFRRVQDELDTVASKNEPILLEHKGHLPYTEATILEIQRLNPIVPLGVLHRSMEPTNINGYRIPANTLLMSNIYAIHHDPKLWNDPEAFDPSRFLDNSGRFNRSPHVIQFSVGKRACLGESLALMELFLVFANILHKFDIAVPEGSHVSWKNVTVNITAMPNPFRLIFERRT
ncbi:uncharacterized protein LOC129594764 [Paramacrobiotus metropolitanus]|uniref:uncharacterized protein LOC129594764 n=1 Tax=Paramacrobiotus metropolitanus TaxID=2943436 RepID=UPI0024460E5C|nr:uncharacterized protein LOC129594764 [Paramacrobiotus metropolitanus]